MSVVFTGRDDLPQCVFPDEPHSVFYLLAAMRFAREHQLCFTVNPTNRGYDRCLFATLRVD
jgi:hypothetical protein